MGILDRLFGRSASKAAPSSMSAADAERVVNAYAEATLAKQALVADASALPHPKASVKQAILAAIAANPDPVVRERLKVLYVSLADWQPRIGPGPYPFDVSHADVDKPTQALPGIAAAGTAMTDIPRRVAAEAKLLVAELKARGL